MLLIAALVPALVAALAAALVAALVVALVAVVEDLVSETRDIALAAVPGRRCKGRNKPWDSGSQAD